MKLVDYDWMPKATYPRHYVAGILASLAPPTVHALRAKKCDLRGALLIGVAFAFGIAATFGQQAERRDRCTYGSHVSFDDTV